MTFQEEMDQIVTHWADNPLPAEFKDRDDIRAMSTIEGILNQLSALESGPGTVHVAVTDDTNPNNIIIKTIHIHKD